MEPRHGPCPQCGGMERRTISETEIECVDCGLGASVIRLTLGSPGERTSPDPSVMRRLSEHRAMVIGILVEPPFPLHGLDDRRMGPRAIGGHGYSEETLRSVSLAHGHLGRLTGPDIRVEAERDERFPPEAVLGLKARSLVQEHAHRTGEMRDDVRAAAFSPDAAIDPMAPWDLVELPVDGNATPFRVLTGGDFWVALAIVAGSLVAVTARSWPLELTGLVTVDDLGPYRHGTTEHFREFGGQ